MDIQFTKKGWLDYQFWIEQDRTTLARINTLIEDAQRTPFKGLGKPEPLRNELSGWWSRRITAEHRMIYRIRGKPGIDQHLEIAA